MEENEYQEEQAVLTDRDQSLLEEVEVTDKPVAIGIDEAELYKPENFINREISWQHFNRRVLEEAQDATNPLLERIRFLTICESNLDEYFMVRIASLKQKIANFIEDAGADGMTPREQLTRVQQYLVGFYGDLYATLNNTLLPDLDKIGIKFPELKSLDEQDFASITAYFNNDVYPILTPLAIDPGHPFPRLANRSLNISVLLKRKKNPESTPLFAVVQVPSILPRLYRLPGSPDGTSRYVWLEDIIIHHLGDLFPGFAIVDVAPFKVTRDSDIIIEEDEVDNLLLTIQAELRRREKGSPVRLEVRSGISSEMAERLRNAFALAPSEVFYLSGAVPLSGYKELFDDELLSPLSYSPFTALTAVEYDHPGQIFSLIKKKDIFLHHPYESFSMTEDFISSAADDPNVLAIKITLYRTGSKSRILDALIRAARNGKQVTALVELKARFDEETNIQWAKKLEAEGIHVVYGLMGFKTHSKVTLVIRREEGGIQRYIHLSTGNYNAITSRIYTDTAILTADNKIGEDVSYLFNSITGYAKLPKMNKLATSPGSLKRKVVEKIRIEAQNARAGKKAYIFAKMNSLVDTDVIRELYIASAAGVKIDLVVRGISCLRPGIPGVSENIRLTSIVGRFLEHSRIFVFENEGSPRIYFSSADWMPRNFNRRIEIMFPIEDEQIREKVLREIVPLYLSDNTKARFLQTNGDYIRATRQEGEKIVSVQQLFVDGARAELERREKSNGEKKSISEKGKKLFED